MEAVQAWQAKRSQRGTGVEPNKPKRIAPVWVCTVGALVADYILAVFPGTLRLGGQMPVRWPHSVG